jgi:hypothetical protein
LALLVPWLGLPCEARVWRYFWKWTTAAVLLQPVGFMIAGAIDDRSGFSVSLQVLFCLALMIAEIFLGFVSAFAATIFTKPQKAK